MNPTERGVLGLNEFIPVTRSDWIEGTPELMETIVINMIINVSTKSKLLYK